MDGKLLANTLDENVKHVSDILNCAALVLEMKFTPNDTTEALLQPLKPVIRSTQRSP